MAANVLDNLANWSTTDSSNQPDGSDAADIDAELRRIQSVVRKYTRTIGANIASSSTVDLSTATGDVITVTGTTTITGLGTVSAGMRFWLVFSGALTLTHNGTSLILPGGANITTIAGDVACFESLGSGNWRCLAYTKNSTPTVYAATGANSDITSLSGLTTPLSIAQGGTGGGSEAAAKAALNLEIGTDVMAYVAPGSDGNVLTSNGSEWVSETPAAVGGVLLGVYARTTSGSSLTATMPAGATKARICVQGGGANMQGTLGTYNMRGGGAGAYAEAVKTVTGNLTVNVGAVGAASSVAGAGFTTITAAGTTAGTGAAAPTTGDINIAGENAAPVGSAAGGWGVLGRYGRGASAEYFLSAIENYWGESIPATNGAVFIYWYK